MPICRKCDNAFLNCVKISGKLRNISNRKYCLNCSPFGSHNTQKLHEPKLPRRDKWKYRRWQRKARVQRKIKLIQMLGGKCMKCGYNGCHAAFDFHRDRSTKSFGLSSHGLLRKWSDLLEEIVKCDLYCCRCHRELEYDISLKQRTES